MDAHLTGVQGPIVGVPRENLASRFPAPPGLIVVVLDRDGRVVGFNEDAERLTGYAFSGIQGEHFWDRLLLPDEIEGVLHTFSELRVGYFPNRGRNHVLSASGENHLVEWNNTARVDRWGRVELVIGVGRVVSHQIPSKG